MDVSTKRPEVPGVFNQESLVSSLKQMTHTLVAFGIPIGVTRQPMLHTTSEIGLGSLHQQVNVIGHPAIGKYFPAATSDLFLEPLGQPIVMSVIMKDLRLPSTRVTMW